MNFYENVVSFLQSLSHFLTIPHYSTNFEAAINFINFALYFVPVATLLSIFTFWVAVNIISFVIRTIKTVWDIVPLA